MLLANVMAVARTSLMRVAMRPASRPANQRQGDKTELADAARLGSARLGDRN